MLIIAVLGLAIEVKVMIRFQRLSLGRFLLEGRCVNCWLDFPFEWQICVSFFLSSVGAFFHWVEHVVFISGILGPFGNHFLLCWI